MAQKAKNRNTLGKEILHFIIHLRLHYQVFILSGGFLLGAFLSADIDWWAFGIQFANVHMLLFGGATAYNSYWDKDEGPVGGLKAPPPMQRWMWVASLIFQFVGLLVAWRAGIIFAVIYGLSILFFWFYSSPHFRWKGTPVRSLIAIGISTGSNSVLLGYLAAGNIELPSTILMAAAGVALMVLSLYPVSQLYQMDEDIDRGDQTFAIQFGFVGVVQFFRVAYTGGVLLVSVAIMDDYIRTGSAFLITGLGIGIGVYRQLKQLTAEKEDYRAVMRIKYGTSMAFVIILILLILIEYTVPGMMR